MDRRDFWSRAYLIALDNCHKAILQGRPTQSALDYADQALNAFDAKWEGTNKSDADKQPELRCEFVAQAVVGGPHYRCTLPQGHKFAHDLSNDHCIAPADFDAGD